MDEKLYIEFLEERVRTLKSTLEIQRATITALHGKTKAAKVTRNRKSGYKGKYSDKEKKNLLKRVDNYTGANDLSHPLEGCKAVGISTSSYYRWKRQFSNRTPKRGHDAKD